MFAEIFETKNDKKILILASTTDHDNKILEDIVKSGAYEIIKYDPDFNNNKILEVGILLASQKIS